MRKPVFEANNGEELTLTVDDRGRVKYNVVVTDE